MKRKSKKQLDVETEKILASGEEGKAGVEAAKEIFKEEEKKEQEEKLMEEERLEKQHTRMAYNIFLANALIDRLEELKVVGWKYKVAPTEEGVVMELEHLGHLFRAAFRSVGDSKLDLNAVDVFAMRAEATIQAGVKEGGILRT